MVSFINNFYVLRLIFIVILIIVGNYTINNLKDKNKINIKERMNLRTFNIKFLLKMLFLSLFLRILIEQIISITNISKTISIVPSNSMEVIMEIITTCVFAPIFEEIIFRFGLYEKLSKKINFIISMLITSIVFSLVHFYNLDGLIILIVISLIWNYAYYKTDNLLYSILLHTIHNIYAIISNFVINNKIYIILCIASLVCYILLSLKTKREK